MRERDVYVITELNGAQKCHLLKKDRKTHRNIGKSLPKKKNRFYCKHYYFTWFIIFHWIISHRMDLLFLEQFSFSFFNFFFLSFFMLFCCCIFCFDFFLLLLVRTFVVSTHCYALLCLAFNVIHSQKKKRKEEKRKKRSSINVSTERPFDAS